MNGANVQQTVVEELRLGAEPAVTLHQLTGEQNVWEMLLKSSLATPTPVQVTGLMFSSTPVPHEEKLNNR